jgi:ribosomal protein S18 acetylase RimI-like enzyme
LEGAFEPKKTMHLSVVYVVPESRRSGVGRRLVEKALEWGRAIGAEYCALNVLEKNPAKSLYTTLGFVDTDVQMTKRIENGLSRTTAFDGLLDRANEGRRGFDLCFAPCRAKMPARSRPSMTSLRWR